MRKKRNTFFGGNDLTLFATWKERSKMESKTQWMKVQFEMCVSGKGAVDNVFLNIAECAV